MTWSQLGQHGGCWGPCQRRLHPTLIISSTKVHPTLITPSTDVHIMLISSSTGSQPTLIISSTEVPVPVPRL